jgi:hypothetical protein
VSYPDIPVACVESGMVMLLEKVVSEISLEHCTELIYRDGTKVELEGHPCPACRIRFSIEEVPTGMEFATVGKPVVIPTGKSSCKYRPLRGPLFVPR